MKARVKRALSIAPITIGLRRFVYARLPATNEYRSFRMQLPTIFRPGCTGNKAEGIKVKMVATLRLRFRSISPGQCHADRERRPDSRLHQRARAGALWQTPAVRRRHDGDHR